MTQAQPSNAFEISPFTHPVPSNHLSKTKQETMSQTHNSDKNRRKLCLIKIDEKSVDRKAHRPALTTERRSRRSRGIFCRKDFCTNFLNTQLILRFLYKSCIYKISSCFILFLLAKPSTS